MLVLVKMMICYVSSGKSDDISDENDVRSGKNYDNNEENNVSPWC